MTVSRVSQGDSVSEDSIGSDTTRPDRGETASDDATASDGGTTRDPAPQPGAPSLDRLVAEAMAVASGAGVPDLPDLVERYWRLVPDEEVADRSAAHLLGATEAHLELAAQRLPGEMKLHVQRGEEGQHSALLIVTDDMPFLVDSVTAAITARGLEVDLVVHPQVVVEREALGALARVLPHIEPDDAAPGQMVESWMRFEVGRLRDDALAATLHNDLQRVLTDVREAVEDWPRMRAQARTLADELGDPAQAQRLPVPEKDITDSVALLRWLANDNFTFLGYREYDLVAGAGRGETPQGQAGHRPRHPAPGPRGRAGAVVDDARGVRARTGEAAPHHHEGQLAVDRAPQRVPRLHRVQDLRRRRGTSSASGGSSACSPRRRTSRRSGTCPSSSAR